VSNVASAILENLVIDAFLQILSYHQILVCPIMIHASPKACSLVAVVDMQTTRVEAVEVHSWLVAVR